MGGYQSLFGKEVQNYLYPFFWQHGEKHGVLEEYIEKIYQSGMKALCVEARPHPDFVGQQWWDDMDFILAELKKRDMKMWILDDSHFPTGFANGKIKEKYPQYLKCYVDCRRYDVQGPLAHARIDLRVLKGRIWDKPEENIQILGVYMARRTASGASDSIAADTLADVTAGMQMADRLLSVDIPAGAFSIFVVFITGRGAEEATKDYLNPLVKEAAQVLVEEVYEPHYSRYKDEFGKTIQGFFSDEPRFGNAKGTECTIGKDMPLPWRSGLEQELEFDKKYLPLLWTKAEGKESDIRFQYMDMITALYHKNFTDTLGGWCEQHGVWYLGHTIEDNGAHARLGYGTGHYFRGQQGMHAAGIDVIGTQIVPGMNYHHDAFNTGGSNGEFYQYALAKLGASAAHLDPLKEGRLMCEAFGAYGWNEGLKAMKWIADSLMTRGVNYIVPHAFNPHAFPDWDCPPHFYAQGHNPQFRYFHLLSDYMNRVMSIFRDGIYPAKVGIFYPAETEWAGTYMPIEKPCRELTEHQISFDIVTRDYLKQAVIQEDVYCINGNCFEVLVFPAGKYLPGDLLPVLKQMIDRHIRIIFLQEFPDTVLECRNNELWREVQAGSETCPLEQLGSCLCTCRALELDCEQKDLAVGEYVRNGMHFYMLFNESVENTLDMKIQFRENGFIYRYDAMEDTLYPAGTDQIRLTPYQSCIYVVSEEKIEAADADCEIPVDYEEFPIPEHWTVEFADSFSYPNFKETVDLHGLDFVHMVEGYEKKAGTVRYSAKIQIPRMKKILLDLGNVYETAEVFGNGISAGVRLCKPYVFDLTYSLKEGLNQLSIEVTNTLGTEVRDALSHYLPIEPFGIEGEVRLLVKKI